MPQPNPLALDKTQTSPLAAQNGPPSPSYDMANYKSAMQQMKLNPQEQGLYQLHLENLYGPGGVDNPDGTRSTLYQTTAEIDGKTYVIPTVWGGKIVSPQQAIQLARQKGLDTFPSYASQAEAEARYQQMHKFMELDTESYQRRH